MIEITLPWPDKSLSPNGRAHWTRKYKMGKKARIDAFLLAKAAGCTAKSFEDYDGKIWLWMMFYSKTKNYPDMDNCLAMCKSYLDGIADALQVNDQRFVFQLEMGAQVAKGGKIVVRLDRQPYDQPNL